MKITSFKNIPKLTRSGNFEVSLPLIQLRSWVSEHVEDPGYCLQLCPDFQRGRVWLEEQKIAYVEFVLMGGNSAKVLYFNMPSWGSGVATTSYDEFVCVDGLQRLTALLDFLNNKIRVFGSYYSEYTDRLSWDYEIKININNLQTRLEVLQWYLELNNTGTPHTKEELDRVRNLIKSEQWKGW